ncbi:MAG: uroporphyrinogen-III synthase, partial [Phycisphaerae bacterium]|nr:uroporphyrinogen-III synthase [Phycisphaerae bacterium]
GVTAAVAAAAYAGIPLTDRRYASTVAFVTGHEDSAKEVSAVDWQALARIDTLAIYMGVGRLGEIADRLMRAGRAGNTPTAIIENAATPKQRTVLATLETIGAEARAAGIQPPAVLIVGKVAAMRDKLAWFEKLPLFGKTILVTRSQSQASQLSARLRELGAAVIEAPTIQIAPPESFDAVDATLQRLGEFDWLVFTSPNGVAAFFDRLDALNLDARALAGVKIAVVGPATAKAMAEKCIKADLLPDTFTTEVLGEALKSQCDLTGKKLLLARADIAAPGLADALRAAGAVVEEIATYRTICPDALPKDAITALKNNEVDWITFTSSSTVENFWALAGDVDLSNIKLAAMGPVT